jgi:chromate transporter
VTSLAQLPTAATPSFALATRFWLKLGFISFGGPAGQIAIMHRELVEQRRWISESRFLHALNYCMVLPGPEAQQLATYIGWLLHGTRGAIVAGGLFVLPSLLILIALSWLYMAYGNTPLVSGVLYGVKPAVVAIALAAAWRLGIKTLKAAWLWVVALFALIAITFWQWPFPLILAIAALTGFATSRWRPQWLGGTAGGHGVSKPDTQPAVIDDHTPTPAHARFARGKLLRLCIAGALLWAAPIAALTLWQGWHATHTQLAWFFTKAALLIFGGAYAVLPYVVQGAVHHYSWLSTPQMIDGLALGETTPGPLIMIVAFVGFVGGWQDAAAHAAGAVLSGPGIVLSALLGAVIATYFTFLPSFLFILGGGPLVESGRNMVKLTAPLTAISAAVVGVIVSLALYFAGHVFWPGGIQSSFDWLAGLIAAASLVALTVFKRGVIEVIAAAALIGLAARLLI